MAKETSKKVQLFIPETDDQKDKYFVLFVNGKRIQIRRGEYVAVDPIVKEIYEEHVALEREANRQKKPLALEG